MNNKKAYIVYNYDEFNKDYNFIKEYYNINELMQDFKLNNKKSVYHYIYNNIEDVKLDNLLNHQYIIIKEIIKDI